MIDNPHIAVLAIALGFALAGVVILALRLEDERRRRTESVAFLNGEIEYLRDTIRKYETQ